MNTFATDTERRTVLSMNLIAGGAIAVADRYNSGAMRRVSPASLRPRPAAAPTSSSTAPIRKQL